MNVESRDPGAGAVREHQPTPALGRVLWRLPRELRDGFTPAQLAALDRALDANNPTRHVINIRLTLFGLAYLVILGGRERRNPARRAVEREKHPLSTPGNIAVLALLTVLGVSAGYALRVLVVGG